MRGSASDRWIKQLAKGSTEWNSDPNSKNCLTTIVFSLTEFANSKELGCMGHSTLFDPRALETPCPKSQQARRRGSGALRPKLWASQRVLTFTGMAKETLNAQARDLLIKGAIFPVSSGTDRGPACTVPSRVPSAE